jgi:hypothetical protein
MMRTIVLEPAVGWAVRHQQIVGSSPTAGSRFPGKIDGIVGENTGHPESSSLGSLGQIDQSPLRPTAR